jgi:hypothetical protein
MLGHRIRLQRVLRIKCTFAPACSARFLYASKTEPAYPGPRHGFGYDFAVPPSADPGRPSTLTRGGPITRERKPVSKRHTKGRPAPPRQKADERTDLINLIVQVVAKGLVDWFIDWVTKGGRL